MFSILKEDNRNDGSIYGAGRHQTEPDHAEYYLHRRLDLADPDGLIGVPAIFDSYIWNTGFNGPKLTVDGSEYGAGTRTFWIRVSKGECYASDTIVINFIESGDIYVAEESMPTLNIYPNPASNFVNIVSETGEISEVQVYDLTGRMVVNRRVDEETLTLNVASLVDATYFVRVIYTDGKASVSKLIINR